ncbi:MAG TPA: tRNA pseudouridine(55) synthase TruB [Candidatus Binatia bacterium]|jgi:tRNA pseudouridine55 synthase|nr:tRNA pseudouridine(55) synthase TruB [Candidatus Binatia bacterium]
MPMTRSGILLIDKPEGPSSAQVVHRVKTILQAKKVGHLGTLDPFASGLLLIGVNEGTKVADIFLGGVKSYWGVIALGIDTDTQDATGKIIKERPVPSLSETHLQTLEQKFTGELQQVPPMFSALKRDGVRLYRLARQGKEVPREPRRIRIDALRLTKLSPAELEFTTTCSRGTYVRTLAADMGEELGCGAHLKKLRRTACDHLTVEKAIALELLEERCAAVGAPIVSLREALVHLPAVTWQSRSLSRLRLGQQELLAQIAKPRSCESLVGILDPRGELAALAKWSEELSGGRWRLHRVFHA